MLLPETLKLHDQSRFEFHYIYFLPWKSQMVEAIEKNGGAVTCMAASNNIQIILKTRSVVRYIRENNIQIIHCHLPWAGVLGRIVYRLTGVPVLYTEHNKQERYHVLTRWMNRLTFNWQSGAIAVSKDVATSIKKNISVRIPVVEIVNGVNTDSFQRDITAGKELKKQLRIPDDALVVGTIAVFRFQKRLAEWLEVFAAASAKHPQLYGVIVGDGPLKNEIVQKVKALGLEKKILMPGLQTDVKPWLSLMDVFMMSSLFEGLPIALLEAMSMECAVVTTDAGGIKEVIRHEADGLIVPVDQWMQLPDQLVKMITEPSRQFYGRAARKCVMENFSLKTMVVQLEELYQSCSKP